MSYRDHEFHGKVYRMGELGYVTIYRVQEGCYLIIVSPKIW